MHVVIFEGCRWVTFAPLSLSRPVFALSTGASSLLEKQIRHLRPTRLTLWVRPEMEAFCRERILPHLAIPTEINRPLDDDPALLFSGRTVHFGEFEWLSEEAVALDEGEIVRFAHVRRPGLSHEDVINRTPRWLELLNLPHTTPRARMVDSLWDLIHWNEESIVEDYADLYAQASAARPAGPYHMIQEDDVWLGPDVKLGPGCVLDASKGPIIISRGASIGPNAVIIGPCCIGAHAKIRPLTQIREGTSIGTMCTVGGEVSHSIMLGYSNKAHEGFLGHSYLGKWVNLGSGTTTSNLKNTYGEIRARIGKREFPSGRQFLGSVIGDHSKTAILSRLSAGAYLGFYSMLDGIGTSTRYIPSFTFQTGDGPEPYQMDKAIEVTKRVFVRRDREFNDTDEQVMRYVAQIAPQVEGGETVV
ncbi:MAG TPA: putative sugar nucleotidyl transferase [Tepidisphaeraceae bacterium]|jgi:UDP-N-acetylglucosamine diphosphorylase/glucosamine-1-phosphate N-acetyltransferase